MSTAYVAGLLTLPALAAIGYALLVAYVAFERETARWGWFWQYRDRREEETYPKNWRLERDLWFERRTVWPLFAGHWYREEPAGQGHTKAFVNRWLGVGNPSGRCFTVYHKRLVGEVS